MFPFLLLRKVHFEDVVNDPPKKNVAAKIFCKVLTHNILQDQYFARIANINIFSFYLNVRDKNVL
jgi:hypothetical protein